VVWSWATGLYGRPRGSLKTLVNDRCAYPRLGGRMPHQGGVQQYTCSPGHPLLLPFRASAKNLGAQRFRFFADALNGTGEPIRLCSPDELIMRYS
jgi:hypothetical protein